MVVGDVNGDGVPDLLTGDTLSLGYLKSASATQQVTLSVASSTHQVIANYFGDSNYSPNTSTSITLASAMGSPPVTLASSVNPAVYGTLITLTATVTGSDQTPTAPLPFWIMPFKLAPRA